MKTLKKVFALMAVVAVMGLSTSCTGESIDNEEQQIKKKEVKETDI